MRQYLIITAICACLGSALSLQAQDIYPVATGDIQPSAMDSLANDTAMADTAQISIWRDLLPDVNIHQARYIQVLAEGGYIHRTYAKQAKKKVIRANPIGYRVEVYQSNDQRVGQQEAQTIYAKLNGRVSVPIYVRFYTPFWRVRLGDFSSLEEANNFKRSFVQQFPNMRAHTYVVRDHIKAIVIKQAREKKE